MNLFRFCTSGYECLHTIQIGGASSFKAPGIVENELGVALKDHFVLDIVKSTLMANQFTIGNKYNNIPSQRAL
jgi:hypothetical protein